MKLYVEMTDEEFEKYKNYSKKESNSLSFVEEVHKLKLEEVLNMKYHLVNQEQKPSITNSKPILYYRYFDEENDCFISVIVEERV